MKESLQEIYKRHSVEGDFGIGDKGLLHSYIQVYEKILAPYRENSTIMEIGINQGHSIRMWREYFENAEIFAVDIWEGAKDFIPDSSGVHVIIEDATKPRFLKHIEGVMFDVVIDDGSHMTKDQLDTFDLLKGQMNKGGIYIIEDILALDKERERYESLHNNCEIVDMRENGRFDNVLVIYRF